MTTHPTRRAVLGGIGATLAVGTAGCIGGSGGSGEDGGPTVAASFFVLGDFARSVVGDAGTVDTLVPVGQHGHGWQPGPDVPQRATEADAFVYMAPGFQPWADDVVENVRQGDGDTTLIEARAAVDLLPIGGSDAHEHGETGHDHGEHDAGDTGHDHGEDAHDGSDHGTHDDVDPHFWLDPTRAATAVGTIADGLAAVDGFSESGLDDRAETVQGELATLDETIAEALADRERDAILVAGHDAFQYLGDRYDVEVIALTGISPDETATTEDVRRAQEAIEHHGVRHVLAPVMESDRAAQSLVADTDAEDVLPITAIPGRHDQWAEKGWGYRDVVTEVNLPTLETALGAQ